MATGSDREDDDAKDLDTQGGGQSVGVPADGELEGSVFNPLGNPGKRHWQASYIDKSGLEDRGNIFFAAVEMTRMPMVVTDPRQHDNPIVFVNRAFLDLTLYEEQDIIGRNCRFLQGPQTDPATVAEIRHAVDEQRAVALDILNYKADGTPFWNALYLGPIFDHEGRLLYFFASQMDVSERRATQQSSMQAQKMEAIGQLTAGMAHDFNNLLQVINGNLELSLLALGANNHTNSANGKAADPIRRAQRAAMKAGKLTQQLLTFARKQRLEPRRINLNSLLVEFSEMLVRTLGDKVELHLDLKPGLPYCTLDPTHLEMALLNVVINARDAMPDGGLVKVGTSLAHGGGVVICVADEGEGMTPEVMQRATEPFFTTKGPGTGLGLAMVHGFVQQSRGRLELDSTPGKGTTVRMVFPVADTAADAPAAEHETADQDQEREADKPRILVVEDNEDVRELAESMLDSAGYAVVSAPSGEEALTLLEEDQGIDLVFTDVLMPGGMNGLQLADQVRARRPGTPILITTGYMDELPAASRAQSLDILTKPYRQEDLLSRVRAILPARPDG